MTLNVNVQLAKAVQNHPAGKHLYAQVTERAGILKFDLGGGVTFGPADITPESLGRAVAQKVRYDEQKAAEE